MNPSLSASLHRAVISGQLVEGEAERILGAEWPDAPFQLRYLGDPVLTTKCEPVQSLDDIPAGLINAMRDVCAGRRRALPDPRSGLGLAANQVGALVRVILVKLPSEHDLIAMVNPVMTRRSDERASENEACLSIPGFQARIQRHRTVTVAFHDLCWERQELALSSLSARVVQHEVDHLDGKQIVDGLSRQLRRQAERAVAKARGLS